MTEPLLTARELGELLGVSSETVLRWTRNGELPAIRLPGTSRGRCGTAKTTSSTGSRRVRWVSGPAARQRPGPWSTLTQKDRHERR